MKLPYKKVHCFGPGGYKCPCCGPNPGMGRKLFRKILRKEVNRIVEEDNAPVTE